ncbi:alpha/beta hydrolase [Stappia sp.]|uniref:alpha/beta hydrolase n=1 Tax=Stappia sp. TaxID=1870903 RepID=UPI003A98FF36
MKTDFRARDLDLAKSATPGRGRAASLLAAILGLAVLAGSALPAAAAYRLDSYKDRLFRYPGLLAGAAEDAFVIVDYDKRRDIHRRDKVWEREVYGEYVSMKPSGSQEDLTLKANGRTVSYMRVGEPRGAKAVVIYVHGQGGNRFQGMSDVSFGGNFNRIKNLMVRNSGLYLTLDVKNFEAKGAADVKALMRHYVDQSPGAKVYVACGSMGGFLCWRLAKDPGAAAMMGGMLLMGSTWDEEFLSSATFRAGRLPIYFGHGSWDEVYDWRRQASFFERLKARAPTYPARFVLFETGTHGTPIRMTDWRLILNWMFAATGR